MKTFVLCSISQSKRYKAILRIKGGCDINTECGTLTVTDTQKHTSDSVPITPLSWCHRIGYNKKWHVYEWRPYNKTTGEGYIVTYKRLIQYTVQKEFDILYWTMYGPYWELKQDVEKAKEKEIKIFHDVEELIGQKD